MNREKKELYIQIYKIAYIANINNFIEDTKYINVLQQLSINGFKTYFIDNFNKLVIHMHNIGLIDSFNVSMLIYLRDINYKQLSEIAILFGDIGRIFSCKKRKMVYRVNIIRKIIKCKIFVIKSFKKIEKLGDAMTNNIKLWYYNSRIDILDRLHLLVNKYYSIEQLRYMGVEIKHITEINNMNYINIESYYSSVVKKIHSVLKGWLLICRLYIDIEINYYECCENIIKGNTTTLHLKHFNVNIK